MPHLNRVFLISSSQKMDPTLRCVVFFHFVSTHKFQVFDWQCTRLLVLQSMPNMLVKINANNYARFIYITHIQWIKCARPSAAGRHWTGKLAGIVETWPRMKRRYTQRGQWTREPGEKCLQTKLSCIHHFCIRLRRWNCWRKWPTG